MVDPYTVALTSCGRFDLLERTLESMFPFLEETPPTKVLIIEDSGDCSVHDVVNRFTYKTGIEIETIVNEQKLGQFRSIDRLYSHVETEWIFHCEDDWEFVENGFIAESFAILKEFDSCSTVSLLTPDSFGTPNCFLPAAKADCGISYHVADARSGWRFVGLLFNPGFTSYARLPNRRTLCRTWEKYWRIKNHQSVPNARIPGNLPIASVRSTYWRWKTNICC